MMSKKISLQLKTEACALKFSLLLSCAKENLYDFDVDCTLPAKFSDFCPKRFSCRLYRNDIERLILYFENHKKGLVDGSLEYSPEYSPLENDFLIQCLDGHVEGLDDGYFSIRILINCGKLNEESSNSYFGFETLITILNMHKFCDDLKFLLKCG